MSKGRAVRVHESAILGRDVAQRLSHHAAVRCKTAVGHAGRAGLHARNHVLGEVAPGQRTDGIGDIVRWRLVHHVVVCGWLGDLLRHGSVGYELGVHVRFDVFSRVTLWMVSLDDCRCK